MPKLFISTLWIFSVILLGRGLEVEAQEVSTHRETTGKVLFTALRVNDSPLYGITALIEGNNLKKEIKLVEKADETSFTVELPIGVYRVTTRKTFYDYRFVRSAFRVRSGKVTRINILPPFRVLEQMLVINEKGARDKYHFGAEPKYKTFPVPRNNNDKLQVVVRYDRKKHSGKIITFSGEALMLSYDAFSIYAGELRINPETLEIEASGEVILEDGSRRERAQTAKIFFQGGELKFQTDSKPGRSSDSLQTVSNRNVP
jgi:hypothetical protein